MSTNHTTRKITASQMSWVTRLLAYGASRHTDSDLGRDTRSLVAGNRSAAGGTRGSSSGRARPRAARQPKGREPLLDLLPATRRADGLNRRADGAHELLKVVATLLATVFIDWHPVLLPAGNEMASALRLVGQQPVQLGRKGLLAHHPHHAVDLPPILEQDQRGNAHDPVLRGDVVVLVGI